MPMMQYYIDYIFPDEIKRATRQVEHAKTYHKSTIYVSAIFLSQIVRN